MSSIRPVFDRFLSPFGTCGSCFFAHIYVESFTHKNSHSMHKSSHTRPHQLCTCRRHCKVMFNVLLPTETIPNNSSSFPMDHMFYFVIRTDNDGFSCAQIFLQTPCVLQPQCQATCELPHTSNQNLSSDYRSEGRNSLYAPCVHKRSMTMILEHGLLLFLLLILLLLLLSLSSSSHCLNSILLITCKALAFGIKSSQSLGWWDTRSVRNFQKF